MEIDFTSVVPILRIFDVAKTDEFYQGFLGFSVDWDHRFDEAAPLYRQVSRGRLILHLSEHHGDGNPGADSRHDARRGGVSSRNRFEELPLHAARPRTLETGVIDPFGNLIRFCEPIGARSEGDASTPKE